MILCFSGTGNSRYIAERIAEALQDEIVDLNAKIKAAEYAPIQAGEDIILVTPNYAWRIPQNGAAFGKAHLACDGLRQRDRQCRKIQSCPCRTKAPAV